MKTNSTLHCLAAASASILRWRIADSRHLVNDSLTDGFSLTDLRRLKPGSPILQRDPDTGKFIMTVDLKQSPDLTSGFTPLPLTTDNLSLTPLGTIEVENTPTPSDTKAFYSIETNE